MLVLATYLLLVVLSLLNLLHNSRAIVIKPSITVIVGSFDAFLQKTLIPFFIMLAHHRAFKVEKRLFKQLAEEGMDENQQHYLALSSHETS